MEREGEVARRVRVLGVIGCLRGTSRGGILRKLHRNLVLSFVIMFSVFFFLIDFSLNSIFFNNSYMYFYPNPIFLMLIILYIHTK